MGNYRFNSSLTNKDKLEEALNKLPHSVLPHLDNDKSSLHAVYETVFNHKAFTGRSGGMFGFEGLGCIYWHMVSKLLLAVQECYFKALESHEPAEHIEALAKHYYAVRKGIGFNKTPEEYGAFPVDPYSHTPKHSGAKQPGMTGQVKEEVLTRFGELGIRIFNGKVNFLPSLLRQQEFNKKKQTFTYLDVNNEWQTVTLTENSLAFTWCQIPIIYQLTSSSAEILVKTQRGDLSKTALELDSDLAKSIFERDNFVQAITITLNKNHISAL